MNTFTPSTEDIRVAAETFARSNAVRAWLGKANSYHRSELPDYLNPPSNMLLSHAERVSFVLEAPAKYHAYLSSDGKRITTWTGETLAEVTRITRYRVTNSPYTNERGTFRAEAIDGRTYTGRHNGPGMHCTMAVKS